MTAREVLDDIKDRLTKATPGPWEVRTDDLTDDVDVVHDQEHVSFIATCGQKHLPRTYADAELIANAPADVARLTRAVDAVLAYGEDRKKATHEGGKQADAAVKSYAYHVERLLSEALGGAS